MAGNDRLSALSDDLLRRVLHFAPAKEAASTAALSSRWRRETPLWHSSGAVNLEMRVGNYDHYRFENPSKRDEEEALFFSRREAFISAAVKALDAAVQLTRLTLRLEPDSKQDDPFSQFLRPKEYWGRPQGRNAIAVLLSHQGARRVEELRLVANGLERSYRNEIAGHVGAYTLGLDSLPSKTLRVLELTNCMGLYQPKRAAVMLPRLTSLRLGHCAQHLGSLQSIIDAAPALATIRLESVIIDATEDAPDLQSYDDNDTTSQSGDEDDASPEGDGNGHGHPESGDEDDASPEGDGNGHAHTESGDEDDAPQEGDGNGHAHPESGDEDDAPPEGDGNGHAHPESVNENHAPPEGDGNDHAHPENDANKNVFATWEMGDYSSPPPKEAAPIEEALPRRLQCPAATVLVLNKCRWEQKKSHAHHPYSYSDEKPVQVHRVEIEAPRLRRFTYTGLLRSFTFSPQPLELEQVDLHFFPDKKRYSWEKDPNRNLATFWQLVGSFTNTKKMKLRLNHLEDIAIRSEARRVELLPETFCHLKQLELQGVHRPKGQTAGVAIANLLRCCPVLHDLRINLTIQHDNGYRKHAHDRDEGTRKFLERKFRYDRDKSVGHLDHGGDSKPITVSLEGVAYDEVSEIPGLSRHSFECLRSSLKRVGLQFRMEKSNCFGVKLIKFFAENAMVLEEMQIDGGNGKLFDHMDRKVGTWIANSSRKRKLEVPSFVVLPLKRRPYRE